MSQRMQNRVCTVAVAALLLAACSGRPEATATQPTPAAASPRGRAAQRIELPGAVDDASVAARSATTVRRQLPEAPEIIRLPDGTVGVKVAAQYYDTIVACRQSDGSYGTNCPPARKRHP
jgi:glucose/arabinose dehydrogenase